MIDYFKSNFSFEMPRFVNPAEFLIKVAIDPKHVGQPLLNHDQMAKVCNREIEKELYEFK